MSNRDPRAVAALLSLRHAIFGGYIELARRWRYGQLGALGLVEAVIVFIWREVIWRGVRHPVVSLAWLMIMFLLAIVSPLVCLEALPSPTGPALAIANLIASLTIVIAWLGWGLKRSAD